MDYEREVRTSDNIRELYSYVLKHPEISGYRGYTQSNTSCSYCWDEEAKTYRSESGRVFFPNPNYVNPEEKLDFSIDELYGA